MPSLKHTTKPVSNAKSILPPIFINKGNTCSANYMLQFLSIMPIHWSPFQIKHFIAMLHMISLNMDVIKNWSKPFNPSNVSITWKCKLFSIKGKPFDFNTQPDVAEMLQINLDKISVSLVVSLFSFERT